MRPHEDEIKAELIFCRGCGLFINYECVSDDDDTVCKKCAKRLTWVRRVWVMLLMGGFVGLLFLVGGCASRPIGAGVGSYRPGDLVKARMFTNFPQYEGEIVTVKDGLGWKWIRGSWYQGNALRVYEVETSDGKRLAAQEYQLQKVQ